MENTKEHIVLFDGVCNLCSQSVQFIIQRDSQALFRFASLQSTLGKHYCQQFNVSTDQLFSIMLVEKDQLYLKSEAVLRIAGQLDGFWKGFSIFRWVPLGIRDTVYDFVAKHRYQWFGKKEICWVPTKELRQRFLDEPSVDPLNQ